MTRFFMLLVGMVAQAALADGQVNQLKELKVAALKNGAEVKVTGSVPPVYTVFRLNDPDRLVIDVNGASTTAIKGHHDGTGPVVGVVASQFSDAKSEVARLLIGLDHATKYDVRAVDNSLVVAIEGAAPAAVSAAPEDAPAETPVEAKVAVIGPATPAAPQNEAPKNEDGVLASRVDEKSVTNAATKLTGVSLSKNHVKLKMNGEIAKFEVIELGNPNRIAIDLFGVRGSPKAPKASGLLTDVRIGAFPDKTRIVLESANRLSLKSSRNKEGLALTLEAIAGVKVSENDSDVTPMEAEIDGQKVVQAAAVDAKNGDAKNKAEVKSIQFKESENGGVVDIKIAGKPTFKIDRPDGKSAVLTLEHATIAKLQEKSLDTSDLETPVKMISSFSVPGAERVRIVLSADAPVSERVVQKADGLQWRISSRDVVETAVAEAKTAGFSSEATAFADESAPQQRRYSGQKVSFEFKDIDLHNLLRLITDVSKKNLLISDDVNGRITIRLRNVPWDQALELVLRTKNLGKEEFGNIIRIAPLSVLEGEVRARASRLAEIEKSKPLSVQLIPVNYANAGDMAGKAKEVLSARGTVSIDSRTNTMIVRDLPEYIQRLKSMVASLDTQTPQVLIEARIVEASANYQREIGVQWGGNAIMSPATGNPTGLVFPNAVGIIGGITGGNAIGTNPQPQYAVSLPVGAGDGRGGAVGLTFGSAGGAVQLNLRLSALEAQGSIRTISAPRITTLDNQAATISQGVSIPFSQVSAAGANTSFSDARLQLSVTPHITADGSVTMNITASNNQPDPGNAGANGQPAIARKEATTNVLVKDGDTTVIGGIYIRLGSASQAGLPILSKIPVIGFFFRNYRESETRAELLIFISPRILNRQAVAQTF